MNDLEAKQFAAVDTGEVTPVTWNPDTAQWEDLK